jgi:hypothetical protein
MNRYAADAPFAWTNVPGRHQTAKAGMLKHSVTNFSILSNAGNTAKKYPEKS